MTFSAPWSVLVDPMFDDEYQFSEPVPLLPPRLEPGSWSATRHHFRVAGNSSVYRWRQRLTATGTEIVETPAGRFDNRVIPRRLWFDSPQPFRYDRTRDEVRWYAPAVSGWIRRQWTGTYIDEGSFDDKMYRRLEDAITQELVQHNPGPG